MLYIQKIVRGFLARKQHQPRYRGIIKIKSLKDKLRRSTDIVNQLKGSKDMILKQSNDIEHLIGGYVKNIQNDSRINPKTIDKMYSDIMTKIDNYNNSLQNELKVRQICQLFFFEMFTCFGAYSNIFLFVETTSSRRTGSVT